MVAMASFLGFVAFLWPFVVDPGELGGSYTPPMMFGLLLLLVLAVLFAEIAAGGIDAKALAMLGVLSAVDASLRPLGAGTAGVETVFFLLVLAGRVFGPGFGFTLGCTALFASALITGGVGPWLPYQMFGAAWVGSGPGDGVEGGVEGGVADCWAADCVSGLPASFAPWSARPILATYCVTWPTGEFRSPSILRSMVSR